MNSATNASVTFFSARALMRCTVEFSSSTRASVISRCRWNSSAASRTWRTSGAKRRRWLGEDAEARARQAPTTCTPMPENALAGTPTARTCPSLEISSSSELRLTLPGCALMSASTDSVSSSSAVSSPSTAAVLPGSVSSPVGSVKTSASSRRVQSFARASRAATSATARSSAWCSADRMMALTWAAVGGSIRSARICRSSSARTCSSRRSSCQITSTRCETSLTRSVFVHSCQPVRSRSSLRCRFAAREVKS